MTNPSVCYDFVFITHLPSFYKVALYNELAKSAKLLVIYLGSSSIIRRGDFISWNMNFDFHILHEGAFETRPVFQCIRQLRVLLARTRTKLLLVNGWEMPEFWFAVFTRSAPSALVLESTGLGAPSTGPNACLKKIFLSQVGWVMASGSLHATFLHRLGYARNVVITRGVGLINRFSIRKTTPLNKSRKSAVYIGRIAPEKNIQFLMDLFKALRVDGYELTIIGGDIAAEDENITFLPHIDNFMLGTVLSNFDFLILPSLAEPWGLVVEEALYAGLPVVVSEVCGASELVESGKNGLHIDPNDFSGTVDRMRQLQAADWQEMKKYCGAATIIDKDTYQVQAYLQTIENLK
jgi:glycosyltransferase involved in cell wall biosynthesis